MADCLEGHVKRDPITGAVAIRTNQPLSSPAGSFAVTQAWLVATTFSGAHFVSGETVIDWDDIYLPPEPSDA